MNQSDILKRPIVTEKANDQVEKNNRYVFAVDRRANKLEIAAAIKDFYGVSVEKVNTSVMPGKFKSRYTKKGFMNGKTSAYKRAYVTLAEGESIDLYAF